MGRLATASLLGFLLVLSLAGTAAAKGDVLAMLDAPIPPDAKPGTELDVGWRAWTPGGTSEWPFSGAPVFIRLTSPDGSSSTEAFGHEDPEGSGHYFATIQVPAGGVRLVDVGLFGESCVNGECTRSDILFELPEEQRVPVAAAPVIVDPPIPAAPAPSPGRSRRRAPRRRRTPSRLRWRAPWRCPSCSVCWGRPGPLPDRRGSRPRPTPVSAAVPGTPRASRSRPPRGPDRSRGVPTRGP
jgi:hypothetical protein